MSRQPRITCGTERSDRRQQILEAAQRCFKIHGFHRTTLRDIAREFGMSVGHIYNYFSNKEAIIEALVETQTQYFIDMLDSDQYDGLSPDERLHRELCAVVDAYLDVDSAQLAVAIMNEALVNARVFDIAVTATTKVREHIKLTYLSSLGDNREYAPSQEVMEARIITIRSMLEGLRFARLFNPHMDPTVLRDQTIKRLMVLIEEDHREDVARFEALKAEKAT